MKRQVRLNVFETNSSSVHSLVICTTQDYNAWKNGQKLFDGNSEKIVNTPKLSKSQKEQAAKDYNEKREVETFYADWNTLSEQQKETWFNCWAASHVLNTDYGYGRDYERYQTYQEYLDCHSDFEHFSQTFKTPKGDDITAFGYYGYD